MITIERARTYYADDDAAHGFEHVLRVWQLAKRIAVEEGADLAIVKAAALLHDVARPDEQSTGVCHARASAQRAHQILRGCPANSVSAVAQAIDQHRFRGSQEPTTLEARVLFDADKLDALGAIGVARAYAVAGAQGQRLWAQVDATYADREPQEGLDDIQRMGHTPVHEYRFKLSRLAARLYTQTGKRIASQRHLFMRAFFEELDKEVAGRA